MTSLMFFTPLNVENNESKYYLLKINKLQYIREGLRTSVKSLLNNEKKKVLSIAVKSVPKAIF